MSKEKWGNHPRWSSYEVSSEGRVRNARTKRLKTIKLGHVGYPVVSISVEDWRSRQKRVHSLVAETFIGPRPDGYFVDHKDDDKTNNRKPSLYNSKSEWSKRQGRKIWSRSKNAKIQEWYDILFCHGKAQEASFLSWFV